MSEFNIAIFVTHNSEPLDFTGPFEVFNNASNLLKDKNINVFIMAKTLDPVNAQGLSINPSYSIQDHPPLNILLIPGGGTRKLMDDEEFLNWIKSIEPDADNLLSVCTGSLVYGKTGLLDNLTVTSHYGSIDYLKKLVPQATVDDSKRYIDNGKIVTAAGISAGIDMSLYMLERLWGYDIAYRVAKYMEYKWERTEDNVTLDHLPPIETTN